MKIRNRSDLIKGLWAEWDKHRNDPTASFIYQYIKEEKDKEACRLTARDIRDYLNAARNEKTSVEVPTGKDTEDPQKRVQGLDVNNYGC